TRVPHLLAEDPARETAGRGEPPGLEALEGGVDVVRYAPELRYPLAVLQLQHQVVGARVAVEGGAHGAGVEHGEAAPRRVEGAVRVRAHEHVGRVRLGDLGDRLRRQLGAVPLAVVPRAAVGYQQLRPAGRVHGERQRQRLDRVQVA